MKFSKGEKITEGTSYAVEFSNAEEVAEMGDYARKESFNLPHQFDIENDLMMNQLKEKANDVMKDKNFDTMVIQKETYEEFVYFIEEDR